MAIADSGHISHIPVRPDMARPRMGRRCDRRRRCAPRPASIGIPAQLGRFGASTSRRPGAGGTERSGGRRMALQPRASWSEIWALCWCSTALDCRGHGAGSVGGSKRGRSRRIDHQGSPAADDDTSSAAPGGGRAQPLRWFLIRAPASRWVISPAVACLSGLKSAPRKRVRGNPPRVQIPPPPPFATRPMLRLLKR